MTRLLAGIYDAHERGDASRLADALAPQPSTILIQGPLRIAYTGSPCGRSSPLCLFDGQLDNVSALRGELGVGRETGAEGLLAIGWQRWGPGLPSRMRGDFAVVIWDGERHEGLIARDQIGIRSMFLYEEGGCLFFATEIRSLLALLPRRPAPDPVGVAHWIGMRGRTGSGTLYEGVRRLSPGAMLPLGSASPRERRYWAPRFVEPLDVPAAELASCLRASMKSAVRRRMHPAGQTGVMMSGGLDSASVAAIAAGEAPGRVSAYSASFPDYPELDESALIAELRAELSLPGVTADVSAGGLVASAWDAALTWQIPLSSWGDFWATPLLRAAASAGVKTMLGGDGGDELFGARFWLLSDRLRSGQARAALGLARELPGAGDHPPRRELAKVLRDYGLAGVLPYALHKPLHRAFDRNDAPKWMRRSSARHLLDSADPYAWKRLDGPRWWASTAHVLTRGVEEAGVFEDHRHRAMTAGLDSRHPMFDLEVLELALRLPPQLTFDRYRDRPILRASMEGLLPDAVRLRPQKALFDPMLVDCLAGVDKEAVRQLLTGPQAEIGAYIDLNGVRTGLLTEDRAAAFSIGWVQQIWRLVTVECWLRCQARGEGRSFAEPRSTSPASVVLAHERLGEIAGR